MANLTEKADRKQPNFRRLPDKHQFLALGQEIFPKAKLFDYWNGPRNDAADIYVRLAENLGAWTGKLELIQTPAGGIQLMSNARIVELRDFLEKHGFSIACIEQRVNGRIRSDYRLCWEDEVLREPGGRIIPYRGDRKAPQRETPTRGVALSSLAGLRQPQKPAQNSLFADSSSTSAFQNYETGRIQ